MIRSLAVSRIQRGLGYRRDQEENIILALQEAQRLLERGTSLPYFLLQEDEALSITSGSAALSLPTRFLREKTDERPHLTVSNSTYFLEKVDFDVATERFQNVVSGKPLAYALRKASVLVWPTRDTTYTSYWSYYKGAVPLTSNVENEWLEEEYGAPEVLIGAAGLIVGRDLRIPQAVEIFTSMLAIGWKGMFADGILREEENLPTHIGGKL